MWRARNRRPRRRCRICAACSSLMLTPYVSSNSCTSVYRSSESASRSSLKRVVSTITAGSTSSSSARWERISSNTCSRVRTLMDAVRLTGCADTGAGRLSASAASSARWVLPDQILPRSAVGAQDRLGEATAGEAAVRHDAQAGAGRAGRRRRRSRGRSPRESRRAPRAAAGPPSLAARRGARGAADRAAGSSARPPRSASARRCPVKPSVTITSATSRDDIAALDVADEIERLAAAAGAFCQRGVGLEHQRAAAPGLLAVGEQSDPRALARRAPSRASAAPM